MTKKETTIRNIIAGLTTLILGALAVYYVISFSLANNVDKKEETSQRSSPEKEKPESSESRSINPSSQAKQETFGSKQTAAWIKGMLLDKLTARRFGLEMVFSIFQLKTFILQPNNINAATSPWDSLNRYWAGGALVAFCLGWMIDVLWAKPYFEKWRDSPIVQMTKYFPIIPRLIFLITMVKVLIIVGKGLIGR